MSRPGLNLFAAVVSLDDLVSVGDGHGLLVQDLVLAWYFLEIENYLLDSVVHPDAQLLLYFLVGRPQLVLEKFAEDSLE